ncbi:MAG: ROK family protein [Acidobacteriota bacterium]|nr:ROK family protein [Acidobacteriota bacterium]
MKFVAGVDLGGTAVNYTLVTPEGKFLIDGLCEHPALTKQGPTVCLQQIEDGLAIAAHRAGIATVDIVAVGLDTPGPASATGVLSKRGSTNFAHEEWKGFDVRAGIEKKLEKPVTYLNDANAAALWGHFAMFGSNSGKTSISVVIGTGTGGGVIMEDKVLKGRVGFGGELGHCLVPFHAIKGIEGIAAPCNCGRNGDLESFASLTAIERTLLPYFLKKHPEHPLAKEKDPHKAAIAVRGLADRGDELCKDIFRVQAHALGLFCDVMINTFDPDAFIIGGGVLEASPAFAEWFLAEIHQGMPTQREEQLDIPIYAMPNGDTAGARGAAVDALAMAKEKGLV